MDSLTRYLQPRDALCAEYFSVPSMIPEKFPQGFVLADFPAPSRIPSGIVSSRLRAGDNPGSLGDSGIDSSRRGVNCLDATGFPPLWSTIDSFHLVLVLVLNKD